MIKWSNTWSGTWSNTWPTHIIWKQTNLILLLSDLSSLIHHPSSETSIDPTLIASRRCHWSATLVARRGHHQFVDRHSETFINIVIILIDAILKEFYKCWSRYLARASAYGKTPSQTYESLIKLLACISTHSSANAFPIRWLSERSSWSPEGPWVKRQEDAWLDAVREPIFSTSTSAFFHWSSIRGRSLSIVRDFGGESRLGLDGPAGLNCQPDGW